MDWLSVTDIPFSFLRAVSALAVEFITCFVRMHRGIAATLSAYSRIYVVDEKKL
jgi:hypothetical protein